MIQRGKYGNRYVHETRRMKTQNMDEMMFEWVRAMIVDIYGIFCMQHRCCMCRYFHHPSLIYTSISHLIYNHHLIPTSPSITFIVLQQKYTKPLRYMGINPRLTLVHLHAQSRYCLLLVSYPCVDCASRSGDRDRDPVG